MYIYLVKHCIADNTDIFDNIIPIWMSPKFTAFLHTEAWRAFSLWNSETASRYDRAEH
jgi:hypothetical protein